jgi:hypothetical protein
MAIETARMREAAASRVADEELRARQVADEELRSRLEMEMQDRVRVMLRENEREMQRWRAELTSDEAEAREAAEMENGEMRQGEEMMQGEEIRRNREESRWSEDLAPSSYSEEDEREDEVGEHEDDIDNDAGTNDRVET